MVPPELLGWWGETVSIHLLECIPAHSLTYRNVSFFCPTVSASPKKAQGGSCFFLSLAFWSVPQAREGRKLLYEHLWSCAHWKVLSRDCASAQFQEFALPELELLSFHLIKKKETKSAERTHRTHSPVISGCYQWDPQKKESKIIEAPEGTLQILHYENNPQGRIPLKFSSSSTRKAGSAWLAQEGFKSIINKVKEQCLSQSTPVRKTG